MASKRLCIVTHTFLPHVGGIERVVYEQGKRLMQHGFEVTVLTSRMGTPESYVVGDLRVKCYDSLNAAFDLGIPYPVPRINGFKPFYKCVHDSDIVHVHGHPYLSSLYAVKLANLMGKPVVLTQHNTFIAYAGKLWDHVEWLNDAAIGMQVLRSVDKIITVSNATKRYVLNLGAKSAKLSVLHNGVDVDRFRPKNKLKVEERKKLCISKDATVVLTVRRLVYKNGLDTFIESADKALKQNRELFFLAVGTGPDREEVQTRIRQLGIADSFRLAGFVSDGELPSFYNAADLFVLPSKSGEGLPLVSLEAMACGLPVIATDVGGIREIIPETYGKFVPPKKPDAMADAILDLSYRDLHSLSQKLRTTMELKFSWEKNVDRLVEIYEQLI